MMKFHRHSARARKLNIGRFSHPKIEKLEETFSDSLINNYTQPFNIGSLIEILSLKVKGIIKEVNCAYISVDVNGTIYKVLRNDLGRLN